MGERGRLFRTVAISDARGGAYDSSEPPSGGIAIAESLAVLHPGEGGSMPTRTRRAEPSSRPAGGDADRPRYGDQPGDRHPAIGRDTGFQRPRQSQAREAQAAGGRSATADAVRAPYGAVVHRDQQHPRGQRWLRSVHAAHRPAIGVPIMEWPQPGSQVLPPRTVPTAASSGTGTRCGHDSGRTAGAPPALGLPA